MDTIRSGISRGSSQLFTTDIQASWVPFVVFTRPSLCQHSIGVGGGKEVVALQVVVEEVGGGMGG